MQTFERLASATFAEAAAIFSQRGEQYQDSWLQPVTIFSDTIPVKWLGDPSPEARRVVQLAALVDVKLARLATTGYHDDSILDALNYLAAFRTAYREMMD